MVQGVPVGKDGLFALVDDEDFALVSQYKWHIHKGYAEHTYWEGGKSKSFPMHRLILGLGPEGAGVDHASHDKLDNRRENLRVATQSQNGGNRHKQRDTTSQYKGVCWDRRAQRWYAQIGVQGKHISLARFASEADAARAYDSAAVHFFGEFACLNLPDEIPAPYISRPRPSSTCRGVCYSPSRPGPSKWRAAFERNRKRHQVGWFFTEAEAITALQSYKREHGL